jgi:hypothetical protein
MSALARNPQRLFVFACVCMMQAGSVRRSYKRQRPAAFGCISVATCYYLATIFADVPGVGADFVYAVS